MLCGDPAQIPNEISAGSTFIQFLLTLPIFGWIAYQVRSVIRDGKQWIAKKRGISTNEVKTGMGFEPKK
jgi:hypothetical protein